MSHPHKSGNMSWNEANLKPRGVSFWELGWIPSQGNFLPGGNAVLSVVHRRGGVGKEMDECPCTLEQGPILLSLTLTLDPRASWSL